MENIPSNNQNMQEPVQETKLPVTRVIYDDRVIKKYVAVAIKQVDGVLGLGGTSGWMGGISDLFKGEDDVKGLTVKNTDGRVTIDIRLVLDFERNIPDIIQDVSEKISETMKSLVGLTLTNLNIQIADAMPRADLMDKVEKEIAVADMPQEAPVEQPEESPTETHIEIE